MKILYLVHQFYPDHYTGTEKFLLNLASVAQRWGHSVKVLTYRFGGDNANNVGDGLVDFQNYLYKGIEVLSFTYKSYPADFGFGVEDANLWSISEKVLSDENPDLIHVAHPMRVGEFIKSARRLNVPYVITLTDFWLMCPKAILLTSGKELCYGPQRGEMCQHACPEFSNASIVSRLANAEEILRGAKAVIVPSRFLGSLFKHEFPFLEPRVIPYGIDFTNIKRNARTYTGEEELTFIFAGQIDYHKGVHILLDAFKRLSGKAKLKLYGSGPEGAMRNFKEMAKGHSNIEFCGVYAENKLGEIFGSVDVAVIPSNWHENNTIVMREALASNVPCIVSSGEGMIEKIQDGMNGFIFRMGDADHLKEIVDRITARPGILEEMKRNIHTYALTTVEQEAYAYVEEYQKLIS